jgi:prepilin-type N-terminal cleavage/methylation domain-containing protein
MNRRPKPLLSAFTLIELLVVIAIIAVLASLLLPVLSKMQEKGYSVKCVSNLRQIGAAVLNYCGENDNQLPGPLSLQQYPPVPGDSSHDKGSLAKLIGRYVGENEQKSTTNTQAPTVFLCPSYEKAVKMKNGPVYVINEKKLENYDPPQIPWGDAESGTRPVKKPLLSTWTEDTTEGSDRPVNLTTTWAIRDADQQSFANATTPPADLGNMSAKPVHGEHRNALFYDFHAAPMPIDPRETAKVP